MTILVKSDINRRICLPGEKEILGKYREMFSGNSSGGVEDSDVEEATILLVQKGSTCINIQR